MKNTLLFLLLILSFKLFSQENDKQKVVSNIYYEKYKKQKKNATILSVTGGVLLFTGIIISQQKSESANLVFSKSEVTGYSIATLGVFSIISSIPFYVSAEKNRKKSITISPNLNSFNTIDKKQTNFGLSITYNF